MKSANISKFLSLVLRHKPETIEITLDEFGWVDVSVLIQKCCDHGMPIDLPTLKNIIATNDKQRFSFNETQTKIRASQGHSIKVDLGYKEQIPPDILFHGTGSKSSASILKSGLQKRDRNHVHLSSDIETALKVGKRHGNPVVFKVLSGEMFRTGKYEFYISDNNVWLTDNVPSDFLQL